MPSVRGFVRYSERQLLADQAVLAGANNVPPGIAIPLNLSEYRYYAGQYDILVNTVWLDPDQSPVSPLEEGVPPDLIWLLRQSTHSCFSMPGDFMPQAMEMGADGYTKVVTTLIDRCFESSDTDTNYNSILDIDDPVLLKQYKVVKPSRQIK